MQATDGQGNTGSVDYALLILADNDLLEIAPATLPEGQIGSAYSATLNVSGGDGAYTGVVTGALPAGASSGVSMSVAGSSIAGSAASEGSLIRVSPHQDAE